jgi:hypothetical protein
VNDLLRTLLGRAGKRCTGTPTKPRPSHWPELEALEEQTVLSAVHAHAIMHHHLAGHHGAAVKSQPRLQGRSSGKDRLSGPSSGRGMGLDVVALARVQFALMILSPTTKLHLLRS